MAEKKVVHLMRTGSFGTRIVDGMVVKATYCGRVVTRDDVNEHGIDLVNCVQCKTRYRREKEKA